IANMAVPSRVDEIDTIAQHLAQVDQQAILRPPRGCLLEGGDVIVLDAKTVLVGYHLRSNRKGYEFLRDTLSPEGIDVYPVPHRQLHLDCCLSPLGMGHLLIHPPSLVGLDRQSREILRQYSWIEIDAVEREHLATNVLSIDSSTIVARDHVSCRRVNRQLESLGYRVEAIGFDGVPATGGSFRCASLALARN
nr:arginine deiminase-related protein [Gammaproteobacteria bacterium]